MIRKLLIRLSSLKIAVFTLFSLFVLVFIGTISQVDLGIYYAQKKYFQSFFVFHSFGSLSLPIFPGGALLGWLFSINLIAALFVRFKWKVKNLGLLIMHIGLLVLIIGSGIASAITTESQMPIREGETLSYSQHLRYSEIVFTDTSHPDHDREITIPESLFKKGGYISDPQLPFDIRIDRQFTNAQLIVKTGQVPGFSDDITQGVGKNLEVKPLPIFVRDDLRNNTTLVVSLFDKEKQSLLGAWLLSLDLPNPQTIPDSSFMLSLRPQRFYNEYSLTLLDFKHDLYPGTDIPKNFSSNVRILNPDSGEDRTHLIYMNHPLRMDGKTYYQASYADENTISIFQVVDNPLWQLPYIACILITVGMTYLFLAHFIAFLRKRSQHA